MSRQSPLPSATFFSAVGKLLNGVLGFDEKATHGVLALDGRVVSLKLRDFSPVLYATFADGRVQLSTVSDRIADVTLAGNVSDFLALVKGERYGESMSAGQIEIRGDLATAQQVQSLMRESRIDWEEILAQATNDVFAYRLGTVAKSGFQWLRQSVTAIEKDLGEYAKYEKNYLPSHENVATFVHEVDALALRVERLESRLQRLKMKSQNGDPNQVRN